MNRLTKLSIAVTIIYVAAVLFLCLYDFSDTGIKLPSHFMGIGVDKYIHFAMFLPFPFLMTGCTGNIKNKNLRSLIIFTAGLSFAAITEAGQYLFTELRSCDVLDFVADALAIVVGTLLSRNIK